MAKAPLIVVGASAGGLDALRQILTDISPTLPAAILAVIHIGRFDANLPRFFENLSKIPVDYARNGEIIGPGRVYLAPPDRHLLAANGHLHLGHGPRENHTRPAVDPLFRSAAELYGPLAIGVILTGHLTDGTAGLWEIKRRGGVAVIQDPSEAEAPGMPQSALQHVEVDHCLKLKDIAPMLTQLASEAARKAPHVAVHHGGPAMRSVDEAPVALTCPECGGAVRKESIGTYTQFRCHTGHTFGYPEIAEAQLDILENALENGARLAKERVYLCRDAAAEAGRSGRDEEAAAWEKAAAEAERRFNDLTEFLELTWRQPQKAGESSAGSAAEAKPEKLKPQSRRAPR